ncbi:Mediator of RNA polymerase II transcription subunit 14 [Hyphodiscus hymeniophilus]|uniref:Mediator of RNA polymerase II transcription subunit 14 n=1 Tax=Hyphodiscus hymeniophilus TaxID=353542 RepID=A0A9P6VN74_9HELO|nr:Mediator of RNA polymerase II transcription subunit 14 [Hyphodiscus hymeniophilus]
MDSGERNGSHTNHDRDQRPNGVNSEVFVAEKVQGKGKEPQQNMTPTSPMGPNALNGTASRLPAPEGAVIPADMQERLNQLPDEIVHITQGFMPLSTLLTRFAQKTHKDLATKIVELAQMPIPASAVNRNAPHASTDDNSAENVAKKHRLLEFAQNAHTDWTKAFVITSWSRNIEDVRKLIDLKVHLDKERSHYFDAINALGEVRRELGAARIPNPDLKTAVQVLSTGTAPWMPEFDYILPPPLTAKDLASTIANLNTLLSIRLNLHEYDKIPWQFKDYSIKSGRVCFRVAGEFDVDLGIADEDPESQFWFIDFRLLFSPSLKELPGPAFRHLEDKINIVLKDGLLGCYQLLHEVVLTHKISEFRRQAFELSRGKWIDALKVELLNRSLSIQYWVDRYGKDGPKSWIILGVHSGRRKDGRPDDKTTSRLSIRWFRNSKEVKETEIPFDSITISAVSLLKTVIAIHVSSILTSIYENMQKNPIFAKHEANLTLSISPDDPAESNLKVQLTKSEHLTVSMEPITGKFVFSPPSQMIASMERSINTLTKDPASDGHRFIENLRAFVTMEDITSHGLSAGWLRDQPLKINKEDLETKLAKKSLRMAWFRRASWVQNWWAVLQVGTDGERWFLVETESIPSETRISVSFEMKISGVSPTPTYGFLSRLSTYAAALIAHFVNLKTLHSLHARHTLQETNPSSRVKVPFILMRLSELLPSKNRSSRTNKAWARDCVKLMFQGLEVTAPEEVVPIAQLPAPQGKSSKARGDDTALPTVLVGIPGESASIPKQLAAGERAVVVTEARMSVPVPQALTILKERVDRDIAFDAKSGVFAFRLRSKVGETVIPAFIERAIRVERLVDFVEVLHKHEKTLKCEYISLGRIIFTYGYSESADAMEADDSTTYKATVDFGSTESVMTLELEKNNPHIRIVDTLTQVLNENQGLDGVATLLPLTLPALRALDAVEGAWGSLSANGQALVFVRAVEWYVIRYNIFSKQSAPRKVMFELRLQQRRGQPWWYIKRTDTRDRDGDDIDAVLKPLWNSSGTGWQGMRVNAVAQPSGMEDLVGQLDEVMRNFASEVDAPAIDVAPVIAQVKPPQRAPEAPMMATPQRQQPTPNQSQNQSQGRNTPLSHGKGSQNQGRNTSQQSQGQQRLGVNREIVEID